MTLDLTKAKLYNAKHAADLLPSSEPFARLVEAYQRSANLDVDAKFGPGTRLALLGVAPPPVVVVPPPPVFVPPVAVPPRIVLVDFIPDLTVADVMARFARISKLPIEYRLSAGGRDPKASDPRSWITRDGVRYFGLDCSGAAAYGYGLDRFQPNFDPYGGWMNTDSIVADAYGEQQVWELLDHPVPGCAIVFPGLNVDDDAARERIGHIKTASAVKAGFNPKSPDYRLVYGWDCAGSNSKLPGAVGDVIEHESGYFNGKETFKVDGEPVTKKKWGTIAVWYKGLKGRPA